MNTHTDKTTRDQGTATNQKNQQPARFQNSNSAPQPNKDQQDFKKNERRESGKLDSSDHSRPPFSSSSDLENSNLDRSETHPNINSK